METKILNALAKSRKAFDDAITCEVESSLSDKGKLVLSEIKDFYAQDKHAAFADLEVVKDRIVRKYPKHADMFTAIINNLHEDVSIENILIEIIDLRKRDVKAQLSAAFTAEGNEKQIEELLEEYEELNTKSHVGSETEANVYENTKATSLVEARNSEHVIRLSPASLNSAAGGGVLRKHHLLFFARPDVGKSTIAIENVNEFLKQGLRVMYIGNEDPPADIILRVMTRITGLDVNTIMANPDRADEILASRNWNNFIFVEMTPGTPAEIRAQVDVHRPDVLIVDQSRNLNMGDTNKVLTLEKAEQFIRNIGKQYDMLTISFTQAGDSGHNKLVLEMNDVDFSNTGMQASADLMVGIGCNEEFLNTNHRVLSYPKNKMTNGTKDPSRIQVDFRYNRMIG
jgi:hypothetical protein